MGMDLSVKWLQAEKENGLIWSPRTKVENFPVIMITPIRNQSDFSHIPLQMLKLMANLKSSVIYLRNLKDCQTLFS